MESYSAIVSQLPLVFGIVGSGVALFSYPIESVVIGGLVGYFLAKALQSVVWTTLGDTRH